MNKKILFGIFAAAILLVTSCQREKLDSVQLGDEVTISFNLGVKDAVQTRAISDGTGTDMLVYAVFDKDGNRLSDIEAVTKTGVTFPTTETVTLAKGQTYKVAFWAQNSACGAYTVDTDNMSVTVNYEGATNNDETRDAFFATVEFEVNASMESVDVLMKRPFAQINVGVTSEDWEAAVDSGIEIATSSVIIKNAATTLNVLDGTVGTETVEVSYSLGTIPAETLMADADGDTYKEDYHWLSMSYILPAAGITDEHGATKSTLESASFVFAPTSGNSIVFDKGLNNIPVQRNWRTNILGKILTGDVTFNVVIDPEYEGDEVVDFTTGESQFLSAIADPSVSEISLNEDLDLGKEQVIEVTHDITIDMNGNEIAAGGISTRNYAFHAIGSKLELINANIQDGGVAASNGAEVIFYSGQNHINNSLTSRYVFYADNSKITIKDGEFSVNKPKNKYIGTMNNAEVYVEGGTWGTNGIVPNSPIYVGSGCKVVITGGKFNFDPSAYVPAGYKVEKSGSWWIVTGNTTKFVDLGLSVLWADRNVKAESETEVGQFYSWADTKDPIQEADGDYSWNWDNYDYYISDGDDEYTKITEITKYIPTDSYRRIQPEDDIATKEYGSDCRIPSIAEINELRNDCTWEWDDTNKGCKITGPNGNSIFIPAGGYRRKTNLDGTPGVYCCIWSSDINQSDLLQAFYLESKYDGKETSSYARHLGMPVRAVKTK